MRFIARIKGLSSQDFDRNITLILKTMDLEEFKNVRASNLSGGNKRKLSCAMTLVLCPKVLFLDEPTTGVDPVSRRSLFRMIRNIQGNSREERQNQSASILLTTHRMDEAEALCDQITIMVNGQMVCHGTPSFLMETYGHGNLFTVFVDLKKRFNHMSDQQLEDQIVTMIPGSQKLTQTSANDSCDRI
jgi:ABC-type multidrug transport system ATPase subunit